jgi:FixJ family two-component response regulator
MGQYSAECGHDASFFQDFSYLFRNTRGAQLSEKLNGGFNHFSERTQRTHPFAEVGMSWRNLWGGPSMETVQQFADLGASRRDNGCLRLPNAVKNIVANLPFQPGKPAPPNFAPLVSRPAMQGGMPGAEKNARAHIVNKYPNYCLNRSASASPMKSNEDIGRQHKEPDERSVVYVVDDDASMRESLEGLIRLAGWRYELFASAQEFLSKPKTLEHSCLVLDFKLPDLTGLDLQKQLVVQFSEMPIVFLTRHGDVGIAVEAMKRGAVDFLTKPCDDHVLLAALRKAFERGREMFDAARTTQMILERRATLSRREHEVMSLVVTGLLNKQIGFELGISEITVKAHRGQVMRKMGAKSLAGLVTMAAQIGFATAPIGNV